MNGRQLRPVFLALALAGCGLRGRPLAPDAAAPPPQPVTLAAAEQQKANAEFDKKLKEAQSLVNQKQYAQCEAALKALSRDPTVAHERRAKAAALLVESLTRQGKLDAAVATATEMLAAEPDAEKRAALTLRIAGIYTQMKPPQLVEADKLRLGITEDDSLPPSIRVRAFLDHSTRIINDRSSGKQPLIPLGKRLLAIKDISGADFAAVTKPLVAVAKDHLKDQTLVVELSQALLAYPGVPAISREAANWNITEDLMFREKFEEAEKRVRIPLTWDKLDAQGLVSLFGHIGCVQAWQGKCDEAVAAYRELLQRDPSPQAQSHVNRMVSQEYVTFGRIEDAAKVYRDTGEPMAEAGVHRTAKMDDKARPIALKVLQDENAEMKNRLAAFEYFMDGTSAEDRQFRERWRDPMLKGGAQSVCAAYLRRVSGAMTRGNYPFVLECLDVIRADARFKDDPKHVLCHVRALAGLGRTAEAAKLASDYSRSAALKPEERYRLTLEAVVLTAGEGAAAFTRAFRKAEQEFRRTEKLESKLRSSLLIEVARTAMLAKRFDAAKEIYGYYEGLFVPQPKRVYTLQFSEQPIRGIESLERLRLKPEVQLHDRPFGGNMEFLETDVSTGNRGADIGSEAGKAVRHTEFSALCDEFGIHLFFNAFDGKAREVEAKLTGAGGYEMYLAPGPNQPYTCFLPDLQNGTNHIWHTTYNNEHHRRIRPDSEDTRFEHVFHDTGYRSRLFVSWEVFYDKLPEPGDSWEFDNLHWKREGGFSWGGSRGIHSRSSWGHLRFSISKAQMLKIKRRIIFSALEGYKAEKSTTRRKDGVISYWQDPELGDPAFYRESVEPLVKLLDGYCPLVKLDMSDGDVEKVFSEAVPGWREIRYKIAELRRRYMEDKLTE